MTLSCWPRGSLAMPMYSNHERTARSFTREFRKEKTKERLDARGCDASIESSSPRSLDLKGADRRSTGAWKKLASQVFSDRSMTTMETQDRTFFEHPEKLVCIAARCESADQKVARLVNKSWTTQAPRGGSCVVLSRPGPHTRHLELQRMFNNGASSSRLILDLEVDEINSACPIAICILFVALLTPARPSHQNPPGCRPPSCSSSLLRRHHELHRQCTNLAH